MLRITLSVVPPAIDDQHEHMATSWKISRKADMTDVIEKFIMDTVNKLDYTANYMLADDEAVYVSGEIYVKNLLTGKVIRQGWSKPMLYSSKLRGMRISNTSIITPDLFTNVNIYDISGMDVDIFTSKFRLYSGAGEHQSTSWFVKDIHGNVIWSRLDDYENKESIIIPESVFLGDVFIIEVLHHSTTNTESNPGRITLIKEIAKLKTLRRSQ